MGEASSMVSVIFVPPCGVASSCVRVGTSGKGPVSVRPVEVACPQTRHVARLPPGTRREATAPTSMGRSHRREAS